MQWASFFGADPERARALALPGIRVLEAVRHPHKIRTGHLRGNRFRIRVRGPQAGLETTRTLLSELVERGTPNYYGEQRFGRDASNLRRARAWLVEGGRPPHGRFDKKLLASALQASWFNAWLAARVREDSLHRPLLGDLMRKEDSGGLFVASDMEDARARLERWEISPTGPIFGAKMRWPDQVALETERALWARAGLPDATLARLRSLLPGTRRVARVRASELTVQAFDAGIELAFSLPKGAYATVVLRELLKPDSDESDAATEPDAVAAP